MLIVQPGRDHPSGVPGDLNNPAWVIASTTATSWGGSGEIVKEPLGIVVRFDVDGMAEVDDALGKWLLKTKQAYTKPQRALSAA
jgi:hypothetical protein